MRAIFGDEAVDSDPHLRTRAAPRGPPGRKLPDVPYFLVVFTVWTRKGKAAIIAGPEVFPRRRSLGVMTVMPQQAEHSHASSPYDGGSAQESADVNATQLVSP